MIIEFLALIFNREQNSLIAIPDNYSPELKYHTSWVTVCPAQTIDEREFDKEFSFSNGSLFVKNMQDESLPPDECKNPQKLSMAWFKETVEFGYEIYVEESKGFVPSHYESYESTKYLLEIKSSSWTKFFQHLIEMSKTEEEVILQLDESKPIMEFIWIPLFKVWFKANRLRKIEYQIRKDNINPMPTCQNYNLGEELFFHADIDSFYKEESQEKAFNGLQLKLGLQKAECEAEFDCLEKWSLIPTDQFQFGSSSPLICSNITTVPIWRSTVKKILEKLDRYLYALTQVSGKSLRIVAGVSGVLALPRSRSLKGLLALLDNYVYFKHQKFTIRAPHRIYKIVKYKTNDCDSSLDSSVCWHGVLIVIENSPFFQEKNRICEDRTEILKWTEIKYETSSSDVGAKPSKYIYACKINQKSIEGVGLTYKFDVIVGEFSLSMFSEEQREEIDRLSKKRRNEQLVLKLAVNEVLERPVIDDEDFDLKVDKDDQTINDENPTDKDDSPEPEREDHGNPTESDGSSESEGEDQSNRKKND
ncbi:uncharacterized protein LOC135840580 [Planococcus citri]|uniref:uncharacterized protein LOC135840580 n=1 Tax=Planococcus citri TaxID=170843 RepID=UPI0031F8149B